jgi:ADP-heptose:LPS heptosyltransferase
VVELTGIRKVLVIRFSSIGDIVLTTPLIRCLKAQTGVEIHFLVKKQYRQILEPNPSISRVWIYDDNFAAVLPQLKAENFDHILDLHKNYRSLYVKMMLRKPSTSFPKLNMKKWLLVNLKKDLLPDIHIADRYFAAARSWGITNDGKGLDYFLPPGEEADLSALPEPFHGGYIAFVIGGKHHTKIFPEDRVLSVCRQLSCPVILLGGPEDRTRGERIAAGAEGIVYNACGEFPLSKSASLIRQSLKVITNDTGLMHIAAAFHKPVISVWGNTVPEFGMYPYLPEEYRHLSRIFEVKGLSCRPCSKIGYRECPKKHFRCMRDQDIDGIIKAAEEL